MQGPVPAASHPDVANKAQQQHKVQSTGLDHTHRWSVQQHNHTVPKAALTPSASRSETRETCWHNRRGKTQLKISRDLRSGEYFSGMALLASRPHPSLLLNTHCGSPKMLILPPWDCRVSCAKCTLQLCVWVGMGSAAPSVSRREAWIIGRGILG